MSTEVDVDINNAANAMSNAEARKILESVAMTTTNPAAKEIAEAAVKFMDREGGERLARAVARYVDEKAETERANRQLLWAMPIILTTALAFLMHALRALL